MNFHSSVEKKSRGQFESQRVNEKIVGREEQRNRFPITRADFKNVEEEARGGRGEEGENSFQDHRTRKRHVVCCCPACFTTVRSRCVRSDFLQSASAHETDDAARVYKLRVAKRARILEARKGPRDTQSASATAPTVQEAVMKASYTLTGRFKR